MKLGFRIILDILLMFRTPGSVVFGSYEVAVSWFRSRTWLHAFFILPVLIPGGILAYNTVAFLWEKPESLLEDYRAWIDDETEGDAIGLSPVNDETGLNSAASQAAYRYDSEGKPIPQSGPGLLMETEDISPFAETLIRKTLRLDRSNTRGLYFAASALANHGKFEQARQIMRSIAPKTTRGHAPAHAWLAVDRLQREGVNSRQDLELLLHDLSIAREWSGTTPLLMSIYSELLVQEGRVVEAIDVLRTAAIQDQKLLITLSSLARQNQRTDLLDEINKRMDVVLDQKINQGLGTESDFICVASIMLLNDQIEQSIGICQQGLNQHRDSPQLRRTLSDGYVTLYDKSSLKTEAGQQFNLEFLDLAMKADSTNPNVLDRLSHLIANHSAATKQVSARLREQLASGKSTAISHLLLAIGHVLENELEQAIVHLEIAHSLAPSNAVVLNNLALAIARSRPHELPRARSLIEHAIRTAGADSQRLDTYGEILDRSGETLPAIRAFEAALAKNPESASTRRKLAEVYEKASLSDMAETLRRSAPLPTEKPGQSTAGEVSK